MSFSKDFLWGAASAAHQIEGAYNEDGKTLGIWDALWPGHVAHDENGNVACDHYHRYKEDVALMKQLGLKSYRFSVSWPRVEPEAGKFNEAGLAFYSSLVDELLAAGIQPMVTLFHWNLPMWMYEQGGWENEAVADHFAAYAQVVIERLSDRVKYWMTLNEPQCFIGMGYGSGQHAPFLKKPEALPGISRNVMLTHGKAVLAMRAAARQPLCIGMAPTGGGFTPMGEMDVEQARAFTYSDLAGAMGNSWWMDPIVLGQVPAPLAGVITPDDLAVICQPLDFYGFNMYHSNNYYELPGRANPNHYSGMPRTAMGWPITPECLYWISKFHYERYGLPLMVTENGMANCDFMMSDGKVHDPQRTEYIRGYLKQLKKAADEGVPVLGYQYWSILDNFEWAEGYDKRFGLVYVDYRTQQRTLKDSAYAYAEIIRQNGENL